MPEEPDIILMAQQFREAVMRQDARALERLIRAYAAIATRLKGKIDALVLQIGSMEGITVGQLARMDRYINLLADVQKELVKFSGVVEFEITTGTRWAINQAGLDARNLISVGSGNNPMVTASFNRLPNSVIETLLGFLQPDSPLFQRLEQLSPATAERIANALIEGVGLGYNPTKIARAIDNAFGMGLTDAMRMTRTAQLWAYREANRATYMVNGDILQGWIWHADLGGACMACTAMHGTIHPVEETLNDHHNGRCTPVPLVIGAPNPVELTGQDWFEEQPEDMQRKMMGVGKFDAWQSGQFQFDQLVGSHTDGVYGDMRIEATLESLMG